MILEIGSQYTLICFHRYVIQGMMSYTFFSIDFVSQPITNCFSCKPSQREALKCQQFKGQVSWSQHNFTYRGRVILCTCCCRISFPIRVHRSTITGRQNKIAMVVKGLELIKSWPENQEELKHILKIFAKKY